MIQLNREKKQLYKLNVNAAIRLLAHYSQQVTAPKEQSCLPRLKP
jgi:hypothetical protein